MGSAGSAAEGKKGAGEAAAAQANCIWLISGTTVTLNFFKKSINPALAGKYIALAVLGWPPN
jgi:hypothetical protein